MARSGSPFISRFMYRRKDEWNFLLVRGVFVDRAPAPNEYSDSAIFTGLLIGDIYEVNNKPVFILESYFRKYRYVFRIKHTGVLVATFPVIKIFLIAILLSWQTHFPNTLLSFSSIYTCKSEPELIFSTDLNFEKFATPFKICFNQEFLDKGCKIVKGRVRCEDSGQMGKVAEH